MNKALGNHQLKKGSPAVEPAARMDRVGVLPMLVIVLSGVGLAGGLAWPSVVAWMNRPRSGIQVARRWEASRGERTGQQINYLLYLPEVYEGRIAEALNVSRPTICRDIAKLLRRYWGGKEAEERLEQQRVAPETHMPELDPVAAPRPAPPPSQDTSVDAPPFTAPQRLPSIRSTAADVFRPHGSREGQRRHRALKP
ncbi:MAG: hypothetical protein R6U98_19740 [Pirellulaceae bacterium]